MLESWKEGVRTIDLRQILLKKTSEESEEVLMW